MPLPRITTYRLKGAGVLCDLVMALRCSGRVVNFLCVFHAKVMEEVNYLLQIFSNQVFFLLGVRLVNMKLTK